MIGIAGVSVLLQDETHPLRAEKDGHRVKIDHVANFVSAMKNAAWGRANGACSIFYFIFFVLKLSELGKIVKYDGFGTQTRITIE